MNNRGRAWCGLAAAAALTMGAPAWPQSQPQLNPVYVDDSPAAAETFSRVRDHLAAGNVDEAVRVLQILLDEQGERVAALPEDPDLFISVREAVHRLVLGDARLLDRYRHNLGPRAAAILERGDVATAEHAFLLTAAGYEAALHVAQSRLEAAQFEAARRTLEQLEDHPDRRGPAGKDAAELLGQVARYLARDEPRRRAERWAAQVGAGAVAPGGPVPWPAPARVRGQAPFDEAPPLRTRGMVSKPLWSAEFGSVSVIEDPFSKTQADPGLPRGAVELLVMPVVSGELVYVNDGTTISAWDQFTLAERWRVNPVSAAAAPGAVGRDGRRGARDLMPYRGWNVNPSDVATVTVKGRTLVAATGRSQAESRDGDVRVHAMDARTGRVRWSVDVRRLDPSLADALVRGPIAVDEGVAVIAARKALAERRLLSLVLVGLDLETGERLWVRPLGSSGMLPYMSQPGGSESTLLAEGVAYRADRLGAIGAFELATGRPVWVRRAPVDAMGMRDMAVPWRIGGPIDDGASLYVLAPDQKSILRLDRDTGRLTARRSTERFGTVSPDYLVKAGRFLVGVGSDQLGFLSIDDFESGPVRTTARLAPPGIHGRVVVAGDRVVAPIPRGLAVFDPVNPAAAPIMLDLDSPGTVVPVESQLIVADDSRLHSYLLWDVAESMLTSRINAAPGDPAPAVTLAELAYRAGRPERILGAADVALAAIAARPQSESALQSRRRLFEALREMTTNTLEARDVPADSSGAFRTGPRLDEPGLAAALVDRMERCATTTDDQVTWLMARGRVEERAGQGARAVASYQRVLEDPALGAATWRGLQLSVRAELEASRRIEHLVRTGGAEVYAEQEERAAVALAELGESPAPDELWELAGRYPLASIMPRVYLMIAAAHPGEGAAPGRLQALEAGVRASARVPQPDSESVGRLAGELIDAMMSRGQVAAASAMLRLAEERFPAAELVAGERTLDASALRAELDRRIAQSVRWPRLGGLLATGAQAIPHTTLLEPLRPGNRPAAPGCVVLTDEEHVMVWSAAAAQPGQLLGKAWTESIAGMDVKLIRADADGALLLFTTRGGQGAAANASVLMRAPAAPGGRSWTSAKLSPLFDPVDPRGPRRQAADSVYFQTPQDGVVEVASLLVVMDERTIAVVQRGGRAAAFDADTGQTLWSGVLPVGRVYDVDLAGDVLVVAGDTDVQPAGGAGAGGAGAVGGGGGGGVGVADLRPIVQTVDVRTGQPLQRLGDLGGRTHWVRASAEGTLIVGLERTIVSVDLTGGRANWVLTAPERPPVRESWIVGDRLIMVTDDRSLWQASLATGRLQQQALDAPRSHMEGTRQIEAFPVTASGEADVVVTTPQGLVVFAPDGALRGVDALGGFDPMLPARAADGRAVMIETMAESRTSDGLMAFQVHQFATETAQLLESRLLVLGAHPTGLTLLDDLVVVAAGGMTVVLSAPAPEK